VQPYNFNLPASGNTYDNCYAQSTGGYGDGFAFIAANMHLNITHSLFRNNTQDGFDGAHLGDDLTQHPTESVTYSQSAGNMGQTYKLGPVDSITAIMNYSSGDCRRLTFASNFPSNPPGWNAGLQSINDSCRAGGDQWNINMKNGATVLLQNNTSVGQGATMWDLTCAQPSPSYCFGTTVSFINNVNMGFLDPVSGQVANGLFFPAVDVFSLPGSVITNNLWWSMRSTGCPQDSFEINCNYADPLFVSESSAYTVNPNILSGSPAINAGVNPPFNTPDFNGVTQTSPPTEGAYVH
jgi:hypothetical protein